MIDTFKAHDERRLIEDYKHYSDLEKLQEKARSDSARLAKLFAEDAAEAAVATAAGTGSKVAQRFGRKDRVETE